MPSPADLEGPAVQTLVSPDADGLAEEAAEVLLGCIDGALASRQEATIVLAGGASPVGPYRALARGMLARRMDPGRIWWLYEGGARRWLLDPIGAPESRIRWWQTGKARLGAPDLAILSIGVDRHPAPFLRYLATARCVVFLASGAERAEAVLRARRGDPSEPAGWIRGQRTLFVVTRDAMGPELPDYGGAVHLA